MMEKKLKKARIFYIEPELYAKFKIACVYQKLQPSECIVNLIRKYLYSRTERNLDIIDRYGL